MNSQDLRRIWEQIDLSPEADERIRRELLLADRHPEQRSSQHVGLRRVERRLSRTVLAAILIGALLTIAAIAAAAVKLPSVVSARQPRLTEPETPAPTAAEERSSLDSSLPSDEAASTPETAPYAPEEAAEALPEPVADTEEPAEKDIAEETPDPRTGWQGINGRIYYFLDDETTATGWQVINGKTYYFLDNGAQAYGWKEINGSWYFFDFFEGGVMATGWLTKLDTGNYYFGTNGQMATGWREIDGSWYYFRENGAQAGGWQEIGGSWYYFDFFPNAVCVPGAMTTGWLTKLETGKYFFGADGRMATGWQEVDGTWYFFREDGTLDVTGPDPVTFPSPPDGEDTAPNSESTSAEPQAPGDEPEPDPEDDTLVSPVSEEYPAEDPPASKDSVDSAPFEDIETQILEDP